MLFDDDDTYYKYVAHYYPDAGEFAGSSGMYINAGCGRFVAVKSDLLSIEPVIAHEMTHASVQIPFLAQNAREHGAVQLVGAGLNRWSNVHIADVVELYLLALKMAPSGAFYFAANGESSFAEIGAALAKRLGLSEVQSLDPQLAAERWGIAKAYFSLGSNSRVRSVRARQELGWAPQHGSLIEWILMELPQ